MRATYDSEADALSIDLVEVSRWERSEAVDDDFCRVAFAGGQPVNLELIGPADHLDLLSVAARRFHLDPEALEAAARSALAAPDRAVALSVERDPA